MKAPDCHTEIIEKTLKDSYEVTTSFYKPECVWSVVGMTIFLVLVCEYSLSETRILQNLTTKHLVRPTVRMSDLKDLKCDNWMIRIQLFIILVIGYMIYWHFVRYDQLKALAEKLKNQTQISRKIRDDSDEIMRLPSESVWLLWNDIYDQQQIGIRSRELHNDHKLATTNILSVLIILYFKNILNI